MPLEVARESIEALKIAKVVPEGNRDTVSDAGVAGLMGRAGAGGIVTTFVINLDNMTASDFVSSRPIGRAEKYVAEAIELSEEISAWSGRAFGL